jgi:FtsH-binding integral membrane protein
MSMTIERQSVRATADRVFFTSMALASALAVLLGFSPSYFLRSAELPALTLLYQAHGALFTAWICLLIVQTALVAGHRTDLHRRLGVAGAFLAAAVFIAGVTVSVETLTRDGGIPGMDPRAFFALPLSDIFVFGTMVTVALVKRRQPDLHKRLMLLATISLLTAAVARFLVQLGLGGPIGLFLATDLFVLALVIYDVLARGRVHPATLWGGAAVVIFKPVFVAIGFTPPWLAFADLLRG